MFDLLINLKKSGQEITIITFDPYNELTQAIKGEINTGLYELERIVRDDFLDIENKFLKSEIKFFTLKIKRPMNYTQQILKKASFYLEGNK
jgi:hypothetical protein